MKRAAEAVDSAKRVARLPIGWGGRATMAGALVQSQYMWGADTVGMSTAVLGRLRKWVTHAVLGGSPARRASEVVLALAKPGGFLEPRLHLLFATIVDLN